jgi:hypothetical protein
MLSSDVNATRRVVVGQRGVTDLTGPAVIAESAAAAAGPAAAAQQLQQKQQRMLQSKNERTAPLSS